MNEDRAIDNLFSDKMENEIKNEIKTKRNKLNLRLIIITMVSTIIIIIGGNLALNFVSNKYIDAAYSKEQQKVILENTIMNPNEYIGKENCRGIGYFKYESTYDYGKRIGSKVIFAGSVNYLGGLAKDEISKQRWTISNIPLNDNIDKRYSSVYGLRKLHFLYPYVKYGSNIYEYETNKNKSEEDTHLLEKENIINDFHFLNEIDDGKIVEMALSFDKEYGYEEVNRMLDSNLITFYWIDNNSDEEKHHIIEAKNPAFNVIGIKSIDESGELKEDVDSRLENFKSAVNGLKKIGDTKYIQNIDENNIKIIGAVVVGTPKELKNISNSPIIKHSFLGNVVDKY